MKINRPPPLRRSGSPIHAHRFDPDVLHQRAHELGEAAADAGGALDDATIACLIDVLLEAAKVKGYAGNISGLRTRLIWTMRDARAGRQRAKRETERHLQRVAIRAIVAGLPLAAILQAAHGANLEADPPLPDAAVATLVLTEIAIERRRQECPCCRARAGRD